MAGIGVRNPWARVQTVESREAGGFMILLNSGPREDRLLGAHCSIAEKVDLYGIKVVGSEIRMRPMAKGLRLSVDLPIELKPRGYHLLFQGLKEPLVLGRTILATLNFERMGLLDVELVVKKQGAVGKDTLNAPRTD
ncbi:copper chaperone PCu(A)C [Reyranella sp.]|jgi:hypothetical protein|uniref:copper chaperone PCu(A)C n=1 Tax=Reyranella sp. TaxID=1929291 RepID=UPI002F938E99